MTGMPCPSCGGKTRQFATYYQSRTTARKYRRCVDCGERIVTVDGKLVEKRQYTREPWYMKGVF